MKIYLIMTNTEFKAPETTESFEALLNEQFGDKGIVGSVVKGTIIKLDDDYVTVDVGLKSEGRIPLALAVIYVAKAPKNNKAIMAIDEALSDIENGMDFPPPMHLRDAHYKDAKKYGFGIGYVYTHDAPEVYQQFMPDELRNKKYL